MRGSTRPPGSLVDPTCPINWQYPLNRGVQLMWAAPPNPGWTGGRTFRDLTRGARNPNDGVLELGSSSVVPTWVAKHEARALEFDSNNHVVVSRILYLPRVTVAITFSVVVASNGYTQHVAGCTEGISGPAWDKDILVRNDGVVYWYIYDGASKTVLGPTISANKEYRVVGVADGVEAAIYVDGVKWGFGPAGDTYTGYTVPNFFLGRGSSESNAGSAMTTSNVTILNRGWSAAEVAEDYKQYRAGYPDVLRWIGRKTWSFPADAGGVPPTYKHFWNRSPVIIGGGIV